MEKSVFGGKRSKTCNCCQARENMLSLARAGNHAFVNKPARENMPPLASAGKHASVNKSGKTCYH